MKKTRTHRPNAYVLYCAKQYGAYKEEAAEGGRKFTFTELSGIIASQWKALAEEEKDLWRDASKALEPQEAKPQRIKSHPQHLQPQPQPQPQLQRQPVPIVAGPIPSHLTSAPPSAAEMARRRAVARAKVMGTMPLENPALPFVSISPAVDTATEPEPTAAATSPPLSPSSAPTVDDLVAMTKSQLREEILGRGLKCPKRFQTKEALLEKIDLPATQWKEWCNMKNAQLKGALRDRDRTVSGTRSELLGRLGVPPGFDHRVGYPTDRKRRRAPDVDRIEPEDDPFHEAYALVCCNSPAFAYGKTGRAGCTVYRHGKPAKVWRCLNCKQIPVRPDASPK